MSSDEVDDVLRGLCRAGARRASIVDAELAGRTHELGEARWLFVEPEAPGAPSATLIAEAAVILRAIQRRRGEALELAVRASGHADPDPQRRARERIRALVEALAATEGAAAAALVRRGELVAEAGALDEGRRLELELLVKRVAAEAARRSGTSHGELVREDLFARSVGLDGTLVLYFERPWSQDFVRHRSAQIARELGNALPHLDADPEPPSVGAR